MMRERKKAIRDGTAKGNKAPPTSLYRWGYPWILFSLLGIIPSSNGPRYIPLGGETTMSDTRTRIHGLFAPPDREQVRFFVMRQGWMTSGADDGATGRYQGHAGRVLSESDEHGRNHDACANGDCYGMCACR